MKLKVFLIGFFLLLAFFYIGGCTNAGKWLVKNDEVTHADAMVILMGSIADRVLQAVDMYKGNVAEHVIFAEVDVSAYEKLEMRGFHISGTTELVYDAAVTLGIPGSKITVLSGKATSTRMEALLVSQYLLRNSDIDSLIIITSAPHSRRASIIFNQVFKKNELPVTVLCCPSKYSNFNSTKWWCTDNGIQVVFSEYLKLINFFFSRKRLDKSLSVTGLY